MHQRTQNILRAALNLDGIGAAYVRVSEPGQDPSRQITDIKKWCDRHGVVIPPHLWFVEDGYRDEATTRIQFNAMLREMEAGRINWIVLAEADRIGTKGKKQLIHYLYLMEEAGCRLYTTADEDLTADDFATFVQVGLKGQQSEDEGRTKAIRVQSAMREMARRGEWNGGFVPFGLDVVCFGRTDMVERWRVQMRGRKYAGMSDELEQQKPEGERKPHNGKPRRIYNTFRVKISGDRKTRQEYNGNGNFPATEAIEVLQLRPTLEEGHLEIIRDIYRWFDEETINTNQIAKRLNDLKAPPPYYSTRWTYKHVAHLLSNPVYAGYPTWNKHTAAKYAAWKAGQQHDRKPGLKQQQHDPADWIKPNAPLFDPIVDPDLYERVQAKFARVKTQNHKDRAPKSPLLWLRGLLYCGTCGRPMQGKTDTRTQRPTYVCATYISHEGSRDTCQCTINTVDHAWAEAELTKYVNETVGTLDELGAAAAETRKPKALADAIRRAVEAYEAALERVGGVVVDGHAVSLPNADYDYRVYPNAADALPRLIRVAKGQLADERQELEMRRDELEAQHDQLTEAWTTLPTPRARDKAKTKMEEVEAELERVEAQLRDVGRELEDAAAVVTEMQREWARATAALSSETSSRRKSDAIRGVVGKLVVYFEPTGKQRPTSILRRWEIVPAVSQQRQAGVQPLGSQSGLERNGMRCQERLGCPSP